MTEAGQEIEGGVGCFASFEVDEKDPRYGWKIYKESELTSKTGAGTR